MYVKIDVKYMYEDYQKSWLIVSSFLHKKNYTPCTNNPFGSCTIGTGRDEL